MIKFNVNSLVEFSRNLIKTNTSYNELALLSDKELKEKDYEFDKFGASLKEHQIPFDTVINEIIFTTEDYGETVGLLYSVDGMTASIYSMYIMFDDGDIQLIDRY